jgi:hypothetical protein
MCTAPRPLAGFGRPPPGCRDLLAISLTWDLDSRVMPRDSTSFSIPRVDSRADRSGDHADQRRLGPPTPLQQPLREAATLLQPRDGQLDQSGPGIPTTAPVAVVCIGPFSAALAIACTTDSIRYINASAKVLIIVPEQVRAGLGQLLSHPAGQVDARCCGHRVTPSRRSLEGLQQDHAVAVSRYDATHINKEPRTPLPWT